jgi:transcriptional accessory protein Tex/SPT6
MAQKVFLSACGFIKIKVPSHKMSSDMIFDILDQTRIHQENYKTAKSICFDIFGGSGTK